MKLFRQIDPACQLDLQMQQNKFVKMIAILAFNKNNIHLLSPEKVSQTSMTLSKVNPQQQSKRTKVDQRNCIRISHKKLPSDFFRVSIEKKFKKKSSVDLCSNKFNDQRIFFQVKQPQTQKKNHSYQSLPIPETNRTRDLKSRRKSTLKIRDQEQKILQRKLLEKSAIDMRESAKKTKANKSIDLTKLKPLRQKDFQQKRKNIQNLQSTIQGKIVKHSTELTERAQTAQFESSNYMDCTFGRGFNNKVSFNIENGCIQNQNQLNLQQFAGKSKIQVSPDKISVKGLCNSTSSNEFLEQQKNSDSFPIKERNRRRILKITEQSRYFDQPKSSSIQKNIINQDLNLFDNFCFEDSKKLLALEESGLNMQNRITSSTNDQRSLKSRKYKKVDCVNLPKIGKTVSFQENIKI